MCDSTGIGLEDNKGKVLLHNEHSVLSILQDTPGVIRHHGLYKESQRIILVLSCVYRHDYDHQKKYQVCDTGCVFVYIYIYMCVYCV